MESILPPLEVFALDEQMCRATGSIPYTSLVWTRRYTKPGEFSMVVPADIYDPSWAFVYTDDRPEMGIIQKVEFSDSALPLNGRDTVTVSGFFIESWLNRIVFLDESPEEEHVYVPKPKRPVYSKAQNPKVYKDPMGDYYYTNQAGDIVSVDDGRVVSDHQLTEVNYVKYVRYLDESHEMYTPTYSYYTNADKTQVTLTTTMGDVGTYDIEFSDDRGNVFYKNVNGYLSQAVGVVDNKGKTYSARIKGWEALPTDDPYGRYVTKLVKGPWQRTEMMEPVTKGDSIDIVMKWARRMMGDWITYVEPEIDGVQKSVDPSFQYLGDLLYSTLYEVGASLRFEYSFDYNRYFLSVYRGKDRTQSQSGNPWAVFSDTWGTLYNYAASIDTSNYKNTCYVLYDYDKPRSFDQSGWPVATTMYKLDSSDPAFMPSLFGIPYDKKRGYNTEKVGEEEEPDIETYLDVRDEKPSCDNDWSRDLVQLDTSSDEAYQESLTKAQQQFAKPSDAYNMASVYTAYEESLNGRGKTHLQENYAVVRNLDTGTINTDRYLKDFDLGDKVDMAISTLGVAVEARIIEVEESYDENGGSIQITIGDELMTTIKKARLA